MSQQMSGRMPAMQAIAPFFQPILSMQTRKIVAYEALGREVTDGSARSLGPFFQSQAYSDEQHLGVDRMLRQKAIAKLAESKEDARLFINLKPSWIYRRYRETGELPTLQYIAKHGLNPARIVIEITEEAFGGRLDELSRIIDVYREHGCQIAIDDIGAGYSNYDRIASIRPNILKIDLKLLKRSATHDIYRALLNSFSILAAQMGSSLLVEGVETKADLYLSLKMGARFVQGFLFSEAREHFQPSDAYEDYLQEEIATFTAGELAHYRDLLSVQDRLQHLFGPKMQIRTSDEADALLGSFVPLVPDSAVRMYICRGNGRQISSNFTREAAGRWRTDAAFQGANWIWRPYFIPNILRMSRQRQGIMSQVYTDLDSPLLMQTYSCPLGDDVYLFLDLRV